MKKGSPQDYDAETGCSQQPTQKSRLGEPHECYSLYRIRRTQENHQFLREDGSRPGCREGTLEAERTVLRRWAAARKRAWHGAMEATIFSAWIYDTLKPYAQQLSMGHPAKMKAITAGKNKSDCLDARMIADLLRCNLLPACYVLPPQLRDLRRLLRYRNLVVQQSVRMQNKMAGLLMENGTPFDKQRLHQKGYFAGLMKSLQEIPESVKDLLQMSRSSIEMFQASQKRLVERLLNEPALEQRVERLMSIRAVGPITALTWALEIADPHRFSSIADAVSYCGLTAAFRSSAGKQQRGPISKQRNAWLQTVLIEAAKLAPRWNPQLAALHAHTLQRGHPNRATLQVARKLWRTCWLWTRVAIPFRYTPHLHLQTPRQERRRRERTKRQWL